MHEVILHHYPLSLFAEKIRRMLAYKGLPWRSVEQPLMAPKPDLVPLTGGYRRIPVLQIGADVYCDTACIARRLERLRPEPACLPADQAAAIGVLEDWADHRFTFQVVPSVIVALLPSLPAGILEDRAAMSPTFSQEAIVAGAPHTWSQALLSMDRLDGMLRARPFLLGDAFTIADAAVYHPLWFAKQAGAPFEAVAERPALAAWFARIEAFGPGDAKPMAASEALAIARDAEPADDGGDAGGRAAGLAVGDSVAITADDYGREQTRGTVARIGAESISVRRRDPALGEIAVHYPRVGYHIARL